MVVALDKKNRIDSEEETKELFRVYTETRGWKERDRLVNMHQNLVRFLTGKFANRGEPIEDLVQVGMIGLINAVDRFDPYRGIKFSTYATPTIVGEIRRYFRDKTWSFKVPRRLQEFNVTVSNTIEAMRQELSRPPTIQEIAYKIGASEEDILEAIELGNVYEIISLDLEVDANDGYDIVTWGDFVGYIDKSLVRITDFGDLAQAIQQLDPQEQIVIEYRFFQNLNQTAISRRLNKSQMQISRLQNKALEHLKDLLKMS